MSQANIWSMYLKAYLHYYYSWSWNCALKSEFGWICSFFVAYLTSWLVFFKSHALFQSRNVNVYELTIRTWNMMWWTWRGSNLKKYREGWKWLNISQGKNIATPRNGKGRMKGKYLFTNKHTFLNLNTLQDYGTFLRLCYGRSTLIRVPSVSGWLINSGFINTRYEDVRHEKWDEFFPNIRSSLTLAHVRIPGLYQKWMKMDSGGCKNYIYPNSYEIASRHQTNWSNLSCKHLFFSPKALSTRTTPFSTENHE